MVRLTLAQQLTASLVEQIGNGTYRVGDRLPSLRECMRLFGHSKNTVINAYEALASQGLVEPRHGQGFFVRQGSPNHSEPDEPQPYARAMDTIWLMRQQFVREPGHSPLGEG
ncbi:MAG: GntR family transcriptional regulator, partial [Pseudomonas helleri]